MFNIKTSAYDFKSECSFGFSKHPSYLPAFFNILSIKIEQLCVNDVLITKEKCCRTIFSLSVRKDSVVINFQKICDIFSLNCLCWSAFHDWPVT